MKKAENIPQELQAAYNIIVLTQIRIKTLKIKQNGYLLREQKNKYYELSKICYYDLRPGIGNLLSIFFFKMAKPRKSFKIF